MGPIRIPSSQSKVGTRPTSDKVGSYIKIFISLTTLVGAYAYENL